MKRLEALREASGGRVAVGVSGKDSLAVIRLLLDHGFEVLPYHLYFRPDLRCRERTLRWVESVTGHRVLLWPHPDLALAVRNGLYRHPIRLFPSYSFSDLYDALRVELGVEWIATGEKMVDSLQRRGMMHRHRPDYLDRERRVAWPIADWNHRQVYAFLRRRRVPLPPEYAALGHGWGGHPLERDGVRWLAREYPDDLRRYRLYFPAIEAAIYHEAGAV